jgi:hypothetical protein
MLHIRVIDKMLAHPIPDAMVTPASNTLVDAIPVAVLLRQQAPVSTAPGYPEDGFDKAAAISLLAHVHVWTGAQKFYCQPNPAINPPLSKIRAGLQPPKSGLSIAHKMLDTLQDPAGRQMCLIDQLF